MSSDGSNAMFVVLMITTRFPFPLREKNTQPQLASQPLSIAQQRDRSSPDTIALIARPVHDVYLVNDRVGGKLRRATARRYTLRKNAAGGEKQDAHFTENAVGRTLVGDLGDLKPVLDKARPRIDDEDGLAGVGIRKTQIAVAVGVR